MSFRRVAAALLIGPVVIVVRQAAAINKLIVDAINVDGLLNCLFSVFVVSACHVWQVALAVAAAAAMARVSLADLVTTCKSCSVQVCVSPTLCTLAHIMRMFVDPFNTRTHTHRAHFSTGQRTIS